MSILQQATIKPLTPVGGYIPQNRKQSMTYVVTPEDGDAYRIGHRHLAGSKVDNSTLLAPAVAEGYRVPGWLGASMPRIVPGEHTHG